jgi:hypothetical protein
MGGGGTPLRIGNHEVGVTGSLFFIPRYSVSLECNCLHEQEAPVFTLLTTSPALLYSRPSSHTLILQLVVIIVAMALASSGGRSHGLILLAAVQSEGGIHDRQVYQTGISEDELRLGFVPGRISPWYHRCHHHSFVADLQWNGGSVIIVYNIRSRGHLSDHQVLILSTDILIILNRLSCISSCSWV